MQSHFSTREKTEKNRKAGIKLTGRHRLCRRKENNISCNWMIPRECTWSKFCARLSTMMTLTTFLRLLECLWKQMSKATSMGKKWKSITRIWLGLRSKLAKKKIDSVWENHETQSTSISSRKFLKSHLKRVRSTWESVNSHCVLVTSTRW